MNCKEGDLAVYIRGTNAGKIVKCVRQASVEEVRNYINSLGCSLGDGGPFWLVDQPTIWGGGVVKIPFAWDALLRPIRDPGEDAQDETLTWLPVPSVTKTPEHA